AKVTGEVAGYLATVFGPDSVTPQSPAELAAYEKVKQQVSDDALNIVYVDYQLTGGASDRPGTGRPDKDGTMWMDIEGGIAHLNPATGELQTWRLAENAKGNQLATHEVLVLDDFVWLTLSGSDRLARFDKRTKTFTGVWPDICDCAKVKQDPR